MDTLSYKTISANKATVNKEWVIIDAQNLVVGRLASEVAKMLRGKNKTNYTPHADTGDNVIIINAEKVRFTGKKVDKKEYIHHTGYPGGQRFETAKSLLTRKPIEVVEHAVRLMLPKNRLGHAIYMNLHVYAGTVHPHEAQKPREVTLTL